MEINAGIAVSAGNVNNVQRAKALTALLALSAIPALSSDPGVDGVFKCPKKAI
jgi:hypothetical protein